MKDYFLPQSYYEPDHLDYQSLQSCNSCHEKEKTYERANEYLTKVIHILYSDDKLNTAELENALDELCYLFDVQLPANMPTIERREKKSLLKDWIEFNNNYLKQLA